MDYETSPILNAAELLGSDTVNSVHYRFEPRVVNVGFTNSYVIVSEYQRIEARGDAMARERAQEQVAIAALKQIKTTEAYGKGLEVAAEAPLTLTRQTLEDPLKVLKNLPRDEHSCRVFSEVARLARLYHRNVARIARINGSRLPLLAFDERGGVFVPLPADYITWSPDTQQLVDLIPSMTTRALWLSGRVSPLPGRLCPSRASGFMSRFFYDSPIP